MSTSYGHRPKPRRNKKGEVVNDGGLKILPSDNGAPGSLETENTWDSTNGSRPSSSSSARQSGGYRPPSVNSATSRRTPTPSKQVHLQTARKKETNDGVSYGDLDWGEHERLETERLTPSRNHSNQSTHSIKNKHSHTIQNGRRQKHDFDSSSDESRPVTRETSAVADNSAEQMLKMCYRKDDVSDMMQEMGFAESTAGASMSAANHSARSKQESTNQSKELRRERTQEKRPSSSHKVADIENSDEFDTDLEDEADKSNDENEDEAATKAPNELMMEFIGTLMEKDWPNAQKLCKMILMFEPDNPEANKFQGLIEEKVALEEELANESGSDYDSDEDDDDDDDEESGSDDDSDDESDSSNDDDDDDDHQAASVPDSGIASISGSQDHLRC